jgi:type IV pilus assembly protein PilY1
VITSGGQRTLSTGTPPSDSRGWYVDLPAGERFVGNPTISEGVVYLPTYVPTPGNAGCASSGTNWLFGLQSGTGGGAFGQSRLDSTTGTVISDGVAGLRTDSTGSAAVTDVGINSLPGGGLAAGGSGGGGSTPTGPPPTPANECWNYVNNGNQRIFVPYPCGRQSWRQIQ